MLVTLKEEKGLTRGILKIINKLLTTLVYKVPSTVTEQGAMTLIGILFQYTSRFKRASTSGKVAELISLYTVIPNEKDLKEPEEILKFIKMSAWNSQ